MPTTTAITNKDNNNGNDNYIGTIETMRDPVVMITKRRATIVSVVVAVPYQHCKSGTNTCRGLGCAYRENRHRAYSKVKLSNVGPTGASIKYLCMYDPGATGPPLPLPNGSPPFRVAVVVVMLSALLWCGCGGGGNAFIPSCGVAVVVMVMLSSTPCGVAVVAVTVSSTPCGVAVVVVMVSSTLCGLAVVVVVLSSTACGVAVVVVMVSSTPLWCGCGAGNGGGNGYKASLSCRSFGCQTFFNVIQGLRLRVQGGSKKCGSLMV